MVRFVTSLISALFVAGSLATNILTTDINTIIADVQTLKTTVGQFVTNPTPTNFEPIISQSLAIGLVVEDAIAATSVLISDADGQEIQSALEAALPVFIDAFSYLEENASSFTDASSDYGEYIAQGLNGFATYALRFSVALLTYMPCDLRSEVAQLAGELETASVAAIATYAATPTI